MQVFKGYSNVPAAFRGAALAIGNFDGVHRGHQALIGRARELGQGSQTSAAPHLAGAMVFDPHPREVFQPERPHFRLMTLAQKLRRFDALGLDMAVVIPFERQLAEMTADDFIEKVLVDGLGVRHVVIGYDFFFGRGRCGSAEHMRQAGERLGFGVSVIPPVAEGGEVFSSSAIRAEIAQGDVKDAARMLGHWWALSGEVVGGFKKGTGMGYPTANLKLPRGTTLAHGIYAVLVDVHGTTYDGAAYLGTRPTFDNGLPVLEVFLIDFHGDLYGHEIEVSFVDFIRSDKRFEGMEALMAQMDRDVARAREILAATRKT